MLAVIAGAGNVRAQGGPPMITDDPGTPGNGKWEINLATAVEHRPSETSWDAPAIDVNYGVGERIQLTLQTAPVVLQRAGRGPIAGLGGTEAALKWRFLDEEHDGVSMSMFPRVIFNVSQSSVRRGLAEDGTRVQLPLQIEKTFGVVDLCFEWGVLSSTIGRSEWLYGIVGGLEVTKTTKLMIELHGAARTSFARDVLTVNVGARQKLNDWSVLIVSLGHDVRTPESEPFALICYGGIQLLF